MNGCAASGRFALCCAALHGLFDLRSDDEGIDYALDRVAILIGKARDRFEPIEELPIEHAGGGTPFPLRKRSKAGLKPAFLFCGGARL